MGVQEYIINLERRVPTTVFCAKNVLCRVNVDHVNSFIRWKYQIKIYENFSEIDGLVLNC